MRLRRPAPECFYRGRRPFGAPRNDTRGKVRGLHNGRGFVLLEAILAVLLAGICLGFIVQGMWTNFRTGLRFQEAVRSLMVMENRLGLLYATSGPQDQLTGLPQNLEKPYDQFTVIGEAAPINDRLSKVTLRLGWPSGHRQGHWDVVTILNNPHENQNTL